MGTDFKYNQGLDIVQKKKKSKPETIVITERVISLDGNAPPKINFATNTITGVNRFSTWYTGILKDFTAAKANATFVL